MAEMVVADFALKGQNRRKPNEILKWRAVNTGRAEEVFLFLRRGFAGMLLRVRPEWVRTVVRGFDLSPSRAGQSALFDGEADIKQLPLWAALRKRCYRSMGHTLVTPPNSFSALSKQRSLYIYLHRELVLHNSIELLNSIWALIYRLGGKSEWKVNLITQCVAFEHVLSGIDILLLEWTYPFT